MSFVVEFSRPLALDGVPAEGATLRLQASAEECRALATRFELVQIDRLEGEVRVEPADPAATFHVAGRLEAEVVQTCVVTLEPVPARVAAEFDRLFSRNLPAESEGEVEIDPEAEMPEPLVGKRLDLGEILAEELSLALDPYPRSAEADQLLAELEEARPAEPNGPFGALAAIRRH